MTDETGNGGREARWRRTRLHRLAEAGELAAVAAAATPRERGELRREAMDLLAPLVYTVHTRALELRRGHMRCAASMAGLDAHCWDRFVDDLVAVTDYLLRFARTPIWNLEGWVISRLPAATVEGYRQRRGASGAQQKPRVPQWLAFQLGSDPWLVLLAKHVLEWVGVPATAGYDLWPLAEWNAKRTELCGGEPYGEQQVEHDVQHVLAVMRQGRPRWHDQYVADPLGRKQAPVEPGPHGTDGRPAQPLLFAQRDERDNARLDRLATIAIDELRRRIEAGEDMDTAVVEIVRTIFLHEATIEDMDATPGEAGADRLSVILGDPAQVRALALRIRQILAPEDGPAPLVDDLPQH